MAGGKKSGKLPDGWRNFTNIGKQVEGTRFIAFKVPLKERICSRLPDENECFTPAMLLQAVPNLKFIVNLTNTDDGRYYDESEFIQNGVNILPLKCQGRGTLPPPYIMSKFFSAIDEFTSSSSNAKDSLIGVHCTHGLNRTGYFICKYMVERLNIPANKAIELFEKARGHKIERTQYTDALRRGVGIVVRQTPVVATVDNWRSPTPAASRISHFNKPNQYQNTRTSFDRREEPYLHDTHRTYNQFSRGAQGSHNVSRGARAPFNQSTVFQGHDRSRIPDRLNNHCDKSAASHDSRFKATGSARGLLPTPNYRSNSPIPHQREFSNSRIRNRAPRIAHDSNSNRASQFQYQSPLGNDDYDSRRSAGYDNTNSRYKYQKK